MRMKQMQVGCSWSYQKNNLNYDKNPLPLNVFIKVKRNLPSPRSFQVEDENLQ